MQRRLRVKGVGHMGGAPFRRLMGLLGGRRRMANGHGNAAGNRFPDKCLRSGPLRRHGQQPHPGGMPAGHFLQGRHGRIAEKLLQLGSALALGQEGRFHMRPQHSAPPGFRAFHHRADTGHGAAGIRHRGAHGRGQESRHAHLVQFPAHVAHRVLPRHGVLAPEGMDMDIHKAWQQITPLGVHHFFPGVRCQCRTCLPHHAFLQAHAGFRLKGSIYISVCM